MGEDDERCGAGEGAQAPEGLGGHLGSTLPWTVPGPACFYSSLEMTICGTFAREASRQSLADERKHLL